MIPVNLRIQFSHANLDGNVYSHWVAFLQRERVVLSWKTAIIVKKKKTKTKNIQYKLHIATRRNGDWTVMIKCKHRKRDHT